MVQMEMADQYQIDRLANFGEIGVLPHILVPHVHTTVKHDDLIINSDDNAAATHLLTRSQGKEFYHKSL